ncbi:MAG: hypothetical protein AAF961_09130 [Planctomycetota bacterium]
MASQTVCRIRRSVRLMHTDRSARSALKVCVGCRLFSLGILLGSVANAAERSPGHSEAQADQLVQAALAAQLNGDAQRRSELLAEAQRASPESAAARWQSGQVLHNGEWQSIEEVGETVSQSPDLQEYQWLRAELGGGLAAQMELAEWCKLRGLEGEEQFHWRNVLTALPEHRRARGRLGLREYRGGLFTNDAIEELQRRERQAEDDFARFEPRVRALRQAATTRDSVQREQALTAIAAIKDAAAIEALCTLLTLDDSDRSRLVRKLGADGVDALAADLHHATVRAIGDMPQHRATLSLLDYAVCAPTPTVRTAAAEQLKTHPKTDYVPPLMSQLAAPIEADFRVHRTPNGAVKYRQEPFQAGAELHRR